jgi:hypothetical protein
MEVVRFREGLSAVPESRLQDFLRLQSLLNMPYAGVALGAILKEKLVPHHALAQSMLLSTNVLHDCLTTKLSGTGSAGHFYSTVLDMPDGRWFALTTWIGSMHLKYR